MEQFTAYIGEAIKKVNQKEAELAASERKDEANLQRIRANVYGICLTMFQALSKVKGGAELQEEYLKKLTALPENWVASYEKAKEHDDAAKVLIEETKLEVLYEVKEKFQELCEK